MQISPIPTAFASKIIADAKKFNASTDSNGLTSKITYYGEGIFETVKNNPNGTINRINSTIFDEKSGHKIMDIFRYLNGTTTSWKYDETGAIIQKKCVDAKGLTTID